MNPNPSHQEYAAKLFEDLESESFGLFYTRDGVKTPIVVIYVVYIVIIHLQVRDMCLLYFYIVL